MPLRLVLLHFWSGTFDSVIHCGNPHLTFRRTCTFWCAAGTGISQLQFANMNSTRNLFVVGFALFMGFSVPQYFREFELRAGHGPVNTNSRWVSGPFLSLSLLLF